jgi:chloramphenicol-sensitive protein RarD
MTGVSHKQVYIFLDLINNVSRTKGYRMGGFTQNRFSGILFSVSAGILWGFVPVYINFLGDVDPFEIVAHRSLWSLVLLFGLVVWRQQMRLVWQILKHKKLLMGFIVTTFLLSANWGIYVYAVQSEHLVSAALGYFIYPICSVMLGIVILGERLDRWAWVAIAFVAAGVLAKAHLIAGVPWVALLLSGTFSLYAVARKRLNVDPILGLFVETLLLLPATLGFFVWLYMSGKSVFFGGTALHVGLAVLAGVLTVVPLILFHTGNRALSMTMASLLFYSNPTTQLLIATLLFNEAFSQRDLLAFLPIWFGIIIYFLSRPRPLKPVLPAA